MTLPYRNSLDSHPLTEDDRAARFTAPGTGTLDSHPLTEDDKIADKGLNTGNLL